MREITFKESKPANPNYGYGTEVELNEKIETGIYRCFDDGGNIVGALILTGTPHSLRCKIMPLFANQTVPEIESGKVYKLINL